MKKLALKAALLCASMLAANAAQATVITFDDLPTSREFVSNGYQGFQWSNWGAFQDDYGTGNSGYGVGTVSPNIVSFNSYGLRAILYSSTVFTVNSLYATAAWYDDLQVTFSGWADGTEIYSMTVSPSATAPTLYTFDWSGIDAFWVDSSGGTQHFGYVAPGALVAMDNITVNEAITAPVPEPETYALLLAGLAVVGAATRRRKAK